VAIETALTDAFGLDHPIAAAPMALVSGGGLGFVGGGYGDHAWMRDQLSAASSEAGVSWGVASSPGTPAQRRSDSHSTTSPTRSCSLSVIRDPTSTP
jgi:hypothetical protein